MGPQRLRLARTLACGTFWGRADVGHAALQDKQQTEDARRARQVGAKGEMDGLEEGWRVGLVRAIEAEVATEGMKREVFGGARERRAAA